MATEFGSAPGVTAVTLEPVSWELHGSVLADWLRRPHVAQWWGRADGRLEQLRATHEDEHALIAVGGFPVGYIRWQTVDRGALKEVGLSEIPDGAIDIDLFIGELHCLGRGVGSGALRLLLEHLASDGDAPLAGLCTSIDNVVAIQVFEKAGFHKLRQYDDPIYGRCWVLVVDLGGSGKRAV